MSETKTVDQPPTSPLETNDRITMKLSAYYESDGEDTVSASFTDDWLVPKSDDGPYLRKMRVGNEWREVDYGWLVDNRGMVIVQNNSHEFDVELLLGKSNDHTWTIKPGFPFFGLPSNHNSLWLRCLGGTAICRTITFPK